MWQSCRYTRVVNGHSLAANERKSVFREKSLLKYYLKCYLQKMEAIIVPLSFVQINNDPRNRARDCRFTAIARIRDS